jgi:hypothetical protein
MSRAFFEGITIGTMGASGRLQWVEDLSALSPDELRIVENYRKQDTQPRTANPQRPSDRPQTQRVAVDEVFRFVSTLISVALYCQVEITHRFASADSIRPHLSYG